MYFELPGQREEVFIGYIESWLILRPTRAGGNDRNDEWKQLLDEANNNFSTERAVEIAIALRTLFGKDGTVPSSIRYMDARADGTSVSGDLAGPQALELVYINAFWIDHQVC
jgi:hypothetical protein